MRTIKFRAWDKYSKIITEPDYISCEGECYNWSLNHREGLDYEPDRYILLQFTGLHDKNGKEIYEGDIVQRGVIVFQNGKFQGNYFGSDGGLQETWEDDLYQEKNIEVLGNIYENPELLKD